MQQRRMTFNEMLEELVPASAGTLIEKARLCSRLAKSVRGRHQQRLAYSWKHQCIKQMLRCCGDLVRLRHDTANPDRGMLIVSVPGHGGLHTHRRWLDAA